MFCDFNEILYTGSDCDSDDNAKLKFSNLIWLTVAAAILETVVFDHNLTEFRNRMSDLCEILYEDAKSDQNNGKVDKKC